MTRATYHLKVWLVAVAVAMGMSLAPRLDGHDMPESASLKDAQQQAARAERFERAKVAMCGSENASAVDLADGSIQCLTKRGHKTRRVAL